MTREEARKAAELMSAYAEIFDKQCEKLESSNANTDASVEDYIRAMNKKYRQ